MKIARNSKREIDESARVLFAMTADMERLGVNDPSSTVMLLIDYDFAVL
jgi:hypothetical protein